MRVITEANDGGRLSIETHVKNNYVTVTFADDGPGIPEENFDKLFDLFFTTRADNGGTGLGLSICHGIVTGHGGNIYAKSKLGEGTTFFVELSITDEQRIDNTEPGK